MLGVRGDMVASVNSWFDNRTLQLRVLTALILTPLFIALILWAPTHIFALATLMVITLAAREWARLADLQYTLSHIIYTLCIPVLCVLIYLFVDQTLKIAVLQITFIWWLLALFSVLAYQQQRLILPQHAIWLLLIGMLVLVPTWLSLVMLHELPAGPAWVLALCAIIWLADSIAYFAGRQWGKTRLADRVSPGKSWEGFLVALGLVFIAAVAYGLLQPLPLAYLGMIVFITVLTVCSAVLGDLFESLIKRHSNHKDSGGLLPGHGGVLDRIDSLTAAAPIFYVALAWMERFS